jgi:hypothetical protein
MPGLRAGFDNGCGYRVLETPVMPVSPADFAL